MTRFVDTSFWVALRGFREPNHELARTLWSTHRSSLLTTNHVLGETWTFLRRREGHRKARSFLDLVPTVSDLTVWHVDEAGEAAAWRWLRRRDEREYSFVDATCFEVMRRFRIREALAFDGDFSAAGFVELRA